MVPSGPWTQRTQMEVAALAEVADLTYFEHKGNLGHCWLLFFDRQARQHGLAHFM